MLLLLRYWFKIHYLTFVLKTLLMNLFFFALSFPFLNCWCLLFLLTPSLLLLLLLFSVNVVVVVVFPIFRLRVSARLISPTWFLYDYYVLFSFMIIFSRLYITMNIHRALKPNGCLASSSTFSFFSSFLKLFI